MRRTCGDFTCVLFYFARKATGAPRAPGIPCALCSRGLCLQSSGATRGEKAGSWVFASLPGMAVRRTVKRGHDGN